MTRTSTPVSLRLLSFLAALVLACSGGDGAPGNDERETGSRRSGTSDTSGAPGGGSTSAADDEPSIAFPADSGTAGITAQPRSGMEPAILRAVRTASHPEFDRVVFDFGGGAIPGYHIEYIDRPVIQCGSGEPMEVAGDGWLRVRLEPARAHEFRDDTLAVVTVAERNRRLTLPNLRQLVLTCDFEAQVEWVLGLESPTRYRVMELREPSRLVVDVRRP